MLSLVRLWTYIFPSFHKINVFIVIWDMQHKILGIFINSMVIQCRHEYNLVIIRDEIYVVGVVISLDINYVKLKLAKLAFNVFSDYQG